MDRKRPVAGWRAASFIVALIAITLDFLQPLAHGTLMRDGGLEAMSRLWGVFCQSTAADGDQGQSSAPSPLRLHECCLGLAQAPVLAVASTDFVTLQPHQPVLAPSLPVEQRPAVAIRDGLSRPRAPPYSV